MVDGVNALMAPFHGVKERGLWDDRVGTAYTSGATHWYDTYETRDGKFVSIASLEEKFHDLLIEKRGLIPSYFAPSLSIEITLRMRRAMRGTV